MLSLLLRPTTQLIVRRCDTRPHYGYPDGRGVFCVAHKKEGMIHLLNETNSAKKEEATRCVLGGIMCR